MFRKKSFYQGFTRLESVLTGFLLVSFAFAAWALLSLRSEDDVTPAAEEETEENGLLGAGDMFVMLSGDDPESQDGAGDQIPSIKGKKNMPSPAKGGSKSGKAPAKPAPKKSPAKHLPPRPVSKKPQKAKDKTTAKKDLARTAKSSKPVSARPRKKIPGIKDNLIDVPPGVMEILEGLESAEWSRGVELKLLGAMRRWAQEDVEAASDFALCIERRGTRNAALSTMLNNWLADSPLEAQAWFEKSAKEDPFLVGDLTRQFYAKLAVKNPLSAMDGLWDLPTAGMKRNAFQSVAQRLINLKREQDVIDMYSTVSLEEDQNIVIDTIMQRMARYEPKMLGAWASSLPDAKQRNRALNGFVSAWSHDYPSAAAAWVMSELPAGDVRARQISTVVGSWLKEDPVEAAEWLLGIFPASRETDPAVERLSRAVLSQDPDYAAAWSFSVTDNNRRWKLMEQIAVNWKRTNPDAARDYINRTDLPGAVKARLLK